MRLHGVFAPLKRTLLLAPSPHWAHLCSTSSSLGGRGVCESDLNSKPPSPLADDKLGSSGVTISNNKEKRSKPPSPLADDKLGSSGVTISNNKGKRSKEAKAKGKLSTDIAQNKGSSSSASKPAKAKLAVVTDKVRPPTSKTKQRAESNDQAHLRVIPSIKSRTSSDHHFPAELSTSHYHATSSADLTEISNKPKRLRRALSEIEVAHDPCIEEEPIDAIKLKRPSKGLLAESLENGDDPNDVSVLANRVVPAKKARKHVRVKAQGVHPIPCTEIKAKTRTRSRTAQPDAEISTCSTVIQTLPKAKLSRKSPKVYEKARAAAVSEGVPNVSTGPDADGKCQVFNGDAKAAAGIPKVKSILGENLGLEFSDVQATGKSFVNVQSPPNQEVAIEARHLFDELPVQYKVESISKDRDAASPTLVKNFKEASLLIAFPIKFLSRWWISCYMESTVSFTDLTYPLRSTHVWVTAYQRAFWKTTGNYCDGETIRSVIKKLRNLQFTVARDKFKWADQRNVHLHSPLTETIKTSKSSNSVFQDDVVKEVLLLVLEPIFEARFSARSHAFRPGRDALTALCMVRKSFQGCAWFISGNVCSQKVYSTCILDSVVRVVKDMRVVFLVKNGFLRDKWMGMEMEEVDKSGVGSNPDLSTRLRFLLQNVFLDQLDQWMEKRIYSLSERKNLSFRSPSSFLFKSATVTARKTPKMEYVRYGTNFLVGFCGSQKEAETLREDFLGFLNRGMGLNFDRNCLPLHHISSEVKFLDHIISRKIVHPIMYRRSSSNGKFFEKRALRIRLFLKASRQSCLSYLRQIGTPASFEEIKEILSILNNWYRYAEDRVKITEYCKLCLCKLYVKGVLGEQHSFQKNKAFLKKFKEKMVLDDPVKEMDHVSERGQCTSKEWLPEHEKNLKELAWLQSEVAMKQVAKDFRHKSTISPQQQTAQVVWNFLKGSYPFKGDYFWEPEAWVHLPNLKEGCLMDELSECAV